MSESLQERQLSRTRAIATILLIAMAVVFVVSRRLQPSYAWLSSVVAFAEAAMVGALADWFAVTALFRRPLGLPIPHTAIIPRNKDRIGESVANFLEYNFITQEVIAEELAPVDFAGASADWLAESGNRHAVASHVAGSLPAFLRMIEDEEISRFLQSAGSTALRNCRLSPLVAELLAALVAEGRHQRLFDHLVNLAADALEANQLFIRWKIHEKSPKWLPRAIDDRLFIRLMEEAGNILEEMKEEDSDWRARFQHSVEEFIGRLRTSPEYEAKLAGMIGQALAQPLFREYGQQVWRDLRERLLADLESPASQTVARVEQALGSFSDALRREPAVQERLNMWLRGFAIEAIVARRHVIADLIRRVIQKWDAETVSRKFELYVGKDLQYIRINGTVVGGLVGLVLHTVSQWL